MVRSNQAWTTDVGGRDEQDVERRAVRVLHQAGQERDEQGREDRADEIGQPAAPADLRADEPDEDPAERGDDQQVEVLGLTEDPARIVDGEGEDDAHQA